MARRLESIRPEAVEALLAWLRAFRHHWPETFATALGADGPPLIERLADGGFDADRYLKLRRIATENLANLL